MGKIRLYRGPFDGKVMDLPEAGRNTIVIAGPKPMSRKQRYEWEREQYMNFPYDFVMSKSGKIQKQLNPRFPQVTANYRLCMDFVRGISIPLRHPDGSLFYEWDQPRPVRRN